MGWRGVLKVWFTVVLIDVLKHFVDNTAVRYSKWCEWCGGVGCVSVVVWVWWVVWAWCECEKHESARVGGCIDNSIVFARITVAQVVSRNLLTLPPSSGGRRRLVLLWLGAISFHKLWHQCDLVANILHKDPKTPHKTMTLHADICGENTHIVCKVVLNKLCSSTRVAYSNHKAKAFE